MKDILLRALFIRFFLITIFDIAYILETQMRYSWVSASEPLTVPMSV